MPLSERKRIDPTYIRAQIDALRAAHPDLWDQDDEQLLVDMLEAETDLHEFLRAITERIIINQSLAAGTDLLMSSLKIRRERYVGREEALRELAFRLMSWAETRNIETPYATLSIRTGQPKVIITDEAALPESCMRVKREPNKLVIRDRLEHGIAVPGAQMSNAEPVLNVRIK